MRLGRVGMGSSMLKRMRERLRYTKLSTESSRGGKKNRRALRILLRGIEISYCSRRRASFKIT